ncbi:MAG: hypothetical protein DRP12_02415 [Candidatus Aenigmatarchaeota archaeon]|nr:MAG: hypothetical protein DRP12_02415 [Candidatus Aenigmarchaeota archaeon]
MARLRIVEDRETVDIDPRGNLIRLRHIEYMIDAFGPYVHEVPKTLWDVNKFKEEVKKRAEELKELSGAEF